MQFQGISIRKLFGRFDYDIEIDHKAGILLITAPNGYGKSTCLKLISDFFQLKWFEIAKQNFSEVIYRFSDELSVVITRKTIDEEIGFEQDIDISLFKSGKRVEGTDLTSDFDVREVRMHLSRHVPYLDRISMHEFLDISSGEVMPIRDAYLKYGSFLPRRFSDANFVPNSIREIIENTDCYFIETQRLLTFESDESRPGRRHKTEAVVNHNAKLLAAEISETTKRYAAEAQKLDQSFPSRLITALAKAAPAPDDVTASLSEVEDRRLELARADLVDQNFGPFDRSPEVQSETARQVPVYPLDACRQIVC